MFQLKKDRDGIMNYKPWVTEVLSIVREVTNNPNKNGLVIIIMLVVLVVLLKVILDKGGKK